jgi:hypothetical protein
MFFWHAQRRLLMAPSLPHLSDQEFKKLASLLEGRLQVEGELPSYQTLVIGLVSGAMGPFSNAPIDTIKTCVLPGRWPRREFTLTVDSALN